jgi:YQGE family putative transporter
MMMLKKFVISISDERRLSSEAIITLWMQSLFIFGSVMSGTFLNLYLWRLAESLWVNGMFNITVFVFTSISFIIGGKLTKQKDKMFTYRIGIALHAIFFLAVVLSAEYVAAYYLLFAIFLGTAGGFYWTGYWTLLYDVSNDKNRIRFVGLNMATSTSASLAGPIIAGLIFNIFEGFHGYMIVFSIAFIVFVITAIISFKIKPIANIRKTYYLRHMRLIIRKDKRWRKSLYGNVVIGLQQGVMHFLPHILLFHVLKKEALVSYLGAILAGISIAVSYIFSRMAKESQPRVYILWSCIGYLIGALLLLYELSVFTVVGYMVIQSICNPIKSNAYDTYFYRLIGTLPLKGKLRTESIVIRELCWNFGRVTVVFFLIVLASDLNAPWLPWVIIVSSAFQFILLYFVEKDTNDAHQEVKPHISN